MTAEIDWDEQRARFEAWFLTTQCAHNYLRMSRYTDAGIYKDRVVLVAWRAWRKALAGGSGMAVIG